MRAEKSKKPCERRYFFCHGGCEILNAYDVGTLTVTVVLWSNFLIVPGTVAEQTGQDWTETDTYTVCFCGFSQLRYLS